MKPKPDLHSVDFQHYWMTYLIVYNRYGAHVKKSRACAKRAVLQLRGSAGDWLFLQHKTSRYTAFSRQETQWLGGMCDLAKQS